VAVTILTIVQLLAFGTGLVPQTVWPSEPSQRGGRTDWPTYMHDNARSGVASSTIDLPLQQQWVVTAPAAPKPAWSEPQPAFVESFRELPKMKFDAAFHVAVVDKSVYFGSSVDNKVYSLDAATGTLQWDFFTGGAVRLAPSVYNGRVYVGSDDGHVYCLDAAAGHLVWKFQAAPTRQTVLGGGKMVSLWPVRTSVVVYGNTAYFGAGVFPGERVYMYAVNAEDGSLVWRNETVGDLNAGQADLALGRSADFSPQGYLLSDSQRLFAPSGRGVPAVFDMRDGGMIYQLIEYWPGKGRKGGTYGLLAGQLLYSGTQNKIVAYKQETGESAKFWFPGRRLVVTPEFFYLLYDAGIRCLDRLAYEERKVVHKELPKNPRTRWDKDLVPPEVDACTNWRYPQEHLRSMILAGDRLIVGGENMVAAIDSPTGKELWKGAVNGRAIGLAAARGRLFVSTDKGSIHCFAKQAPVAIPVAIPVPTKAPPFYPRDRLTPLYNEAVTTIVTHAGIQPRRGYGLVFGNGTGRLAYELARKTGLMIYDVEPNEAATRKARQVLDATGFYGTRVCVDTIATAAGEPGRLPYSDYFANLVVFEEAITSGSLPAMATEAYRVLKPCGGVLLVGQPDGVRREEHTLDHERLKRWTTSLRAGEQAEFISDQEMWVKLVRGPLRGAGSWTHQYADSGNTGDSGDQIVKAPLSVLWYGEPGSGRSFNRHAQTAAPLSAGGRVFMLGAELKKGSSSGRNGRPDGTTFVTCFDAYNGQTYWRQEVPGAFRGDMVHECGNMACNEDSLFVAAGSSCLRLDAVTGHVRAIYQTENKDNWMYVGVSDGRLFGSTSATRYHSDAVFAVDLKTGKTIWTCQGKQIRNNSICISQGRLFFTERAATDAQRQAAIEPTLAQLNSEQQLGEAEIAKVLKEADVRTVVAVDVKTGRKIWAQAVDLTGCGGNALSAICREGVLLICAALKNGHYTSRFLAGKFRSVRAAALSTKDGSLLWSKSLGYCIRPLVVGDTLYAEPWAFELSTGRQKMRIHPWTGKPTPWEIDFRDKHCGAYAGCSGLLLFRSRSTGFYDLLNDHGTEHFPGIRPGCWINTIPAGGLVIQPDASSGCVCSESLQCTLVLQPTKLRKTWGRFALRGPAWPLRQMLINLGGPGDRRDDQGKLWLGYPRPPRGHSTVRWKLYFSFDVAGDPACQYFHRAPEHSSITAPQNCWLYSSGSVGIKRLSVPVLVEHETPARFTVRLHFADCHNTAIGQRIFDIKLQGNLVEKDFDVVRAAGGPGTAIVREFGDIEIRDKLHIELLQKAHMKSKSNRHKTILNALEIARDVDTSQLQK